MTTTAAIPLTGGPIPGPSRRCWTRAEFERAAAAGLFGPEERLELIHGEIYQKMTQNSPHATAATLATPIAVADLLP